MEAEASPAARRALFLDRDGVINVDQGYVHAIESFRFIDGIFDLCRAAKQLDLLLVVVTNQAGIARGYYTEWDFARLTTWMIGRFAQEECPLAAVYYCPFHPDAGVGRYRRESTDRKPQPGMLLRARDEFRIDLSRSVLVGDKASDMLAGRAAGVGANVMLRAAETDGELAGADLVVRSLRELTACLKPLLP